MTNSDSNFNKAADPVDVAAVYAFIKGDMSPVAFLRHRDITCFLTPEGRRNLSPGILSRYVAYLRDDIEIDALDSLFWEVLLPFANWESRFSGVDLNSKIRDLPEADLARIRRVVATAFRRFSTHPTDDPYFGIKLEFREAVPDV